MKQVFTSNKQIKLGETAPNFKAVDKDINDVLLYDIKAKRKVILSVPSINTGVCDIQSKTFSEKIDQDPNIELIVISLDLPFAQDKWCCSEEINNIRMLSDYKYHDFSEKFGLKLEGLELIGRTVIILDEENKVEYLEICENVPDHPDYEKAFEFLGIK